MGHQVAAGHIVVGKGVECDTCIFDGSQRQKDFAPWWNFDFALIGDYFGDSPPVALQPDDVGLSHHHQALKDILAIHIVAGAGLIRFRLGQPRGAGQKWDGAELVHRETTGASRGRSHSQRRFQLLDVLLAVLHGCAKLAEEFSAAAVLAIQ